jgi:leader peptidase (prepilin peptidase) / N-methyltransferase
MTVDRAERSTADGARARTTPSTSRLALATAAAAILVASLTISADLLGALGALLGWLMLAIAQSDARRFVVPDPLAAAALLAIELIYRRLRGRAGLGPGDVKLAGVAGAWLSASLLPAAIELAALAALLAYAARQIRKRRRFRSGSRLPFAVFLAPSIWIVWLFETCDRSF